MYLSLIVAAVTRALSVILIPWNISNFSFSPRSIEIVSSTEGSFTSIGWNLLSRAASFSIYFLYSSIVVAPITLITALSLSSNSPLYFAPDMRAPISSENIVLSFRFSGTSPFSILWAIPSAMAVLPTPGSPISIGLFLFLLDKI